MNRKIARNGGPPWGDAVGDALLLASLAWSIFAIGGTLPWSVAGLLLLVTLSAVVNAALGRFRLDAGVVTLVGLGVYTSLQAVSLPLWLVQFVDPLHGETWARTFRLLEHTGAAALSLEPDTTRYEAVRVLTYGLTWGVVSGLAKRHGPLMVARWVVWLVACAAVVTVLHRVFGLRSVYGVYAPRFVGPRWVGPLLNPNNLGGLCNLGVFCALACSGRRGEIGNPIYVVVAAGLACLTLLTGSRGASIALVGGIALFVIGWVRTRSQHSRAQHWILAYAGVSLLALVALTLDQPTLQDLTGNSVEKLALLRWGVEVAGKHPWVGVGMGAFGAEVSTVSGMSGNIVFPYVECLPLDVLVGWGAVVGGVALVTLGLGFSRIGGGFRTYTLRLGLGVVFLQNLMDLGLQVPGLMLPTLAVFASCWGGATRRTWSIEAVRWSWCTIAGAVVLGGLLAWPVKSAAGMVRAEVAAQLPSPHFRALLKEALLRYPGDAYLLRTRAAVSVSEASPDAVAWINSALLRAPADARTHLLLAQLLFSRGQVEQAVSALRRAAHDPSVHGEVVALAWRRTPNRLIDIAPDNLVGASLLRLAAGNAAAEQRLILLDAAAKRAPKNAEIAVNLTTAKLHHLAAASASCPAESACQAELNALVSHCEALGAAPHRVRLLRAQVQALAGDHRGAFDALLPGCERSLRDRPCLELLLHVGAKLGPVEYEQASRAFLDAACAGARGCSAERMTVARQLARQGRVAAAHQLYVQEGAQSGLVDAFVQAALTAAQLGREREAWHWLLKGEQRHVGDRGALERLGAARRQLGISGPAVKLEEGNEMPAGVRGN